MELLGGLWSYVLPFLVVLTVLVFVHELGHYWVARRNGVRVEVFSIGFGPEIWGRTDRLGTRWKISALPFGGYVRFFGDADAASRPDGSTSSLSAEEQAVSFHHKRLGQRAAIVAAGPVANFLFAIVLLAGLFAFVGQPSVTAVINEVVPDQPAAEAGILPGDEIVAIGGRQVTRFDEVQQVVVANPGATVDVVVRRDGAELSLPVTLSVVEGQAEDGTVTRTGRLGVAGGAVVYNREDPFTSVWRATTETVSLTGATLAAVGEMLTGARTAEDLAGPLRIAQMSGDMAQTGIVAVVWFMALLSINLGLLNLFPIPMLDGGHLLFYAAEAVRGRPLSDRMQEYGFRIGLALVLGLMVVATWNDLVQLRVVAFFVGLFT